VILRVIQKELKARVDVMNTGDPCGGNAYKFRRPKCGRKCLQISKAKVWGKKINGSSTIWFTVDVHINTSLLSNKFLKVFNSV